MHEHLRPRAEKDDTEAFSLSVQDLLNRVIQTAVRSCLNYPDNGADPRFKPPTCVTHVDIDRRKIKTIVIAVDQVKEHWWKVAAAVAAICTLKPSAVKTLEQDEVQYQDFLAHGAAAYTAAIDKGETITYCQISIPMDWRKVFGLEGYKAINSRKKWMAAVQGVEECILAKVQLDLNLSRQGARRGMLNYESIRNNYEMLPDETYLLYRTKKNHLGMADTVRWSPSKSRIYYRFN